MPKHSLKPPHGLGAMYNQPSGGSGGSKMYGNPQGGGARGGFGDNQGFSGYGGYRNVTAERPGSRGMGQWGQDPVNPMSRGNDYNMGNAQGGGFGGFGGQQNPWGQGVGTPGGLQWGGHQMLPGGPMPYNQQMQQLQFSDMESMMGMLQDEIPMMMGLNSYGSGYGSY